MTGEYRKLTREELNEMAGEELSERAASAGTSRGSAEAPRTSSAGR